MKKNPLEVKADEVKADEVKADEVKADEVKADEVKADEVKADEVKADEVKADEVKADYRVVRPKLLAISYNAIIKKHKKEYNQVHKQIKGQILSGSIVIRFEKEVSAPIQFVLKLEGFVYKNKKIFLNQEEK